MTYYSEGGYCTDEVRRAPYADPAAGFCHGEGGERYAFRKEYEEVDEVARAGRGHYGHGHGHLGHSGSHNIHAGGHEGCGGHLGERREHHVHGHGHGLGERRYDACESKRYDSCTGQYYA